MLINGPICSAILVEKSGGNLACASRGCAFLPGSPASRKSGLGALATVRIIRRDIDVGVQHPESMATALHTGLDPRGRHGANR
jgi:hypothetical protein